MNPYIIPLIIILLICIVCVIYIIGSLLSIHERVIFYEKIEDNNVYKVYLKNGVFPLTINKIYNDEITMYADITFNYVKFYRVPSPLIFNFVHKTHEYNYGSICGELQNYSNITT